MAHFGDVTIKFDEEQLKRFEAASARFPEDVLLSPSEKQAQSTVTIEVPVGAGTELLRCHSIGTINLSARQGAALHRLVYSLIDCNALISGKKVVNRQDAIQWLLDRVADQIDEA